MAVTGARLAWVAETDRYAAAVLTHHWPDVPNLGDITALNWAKVPPVDLVSAGWPCQDISYAGPGASITEGTRSGPWLAIADGLRHLRPAYVFLENVAALRTRGLAKVLGDRPGPAALAPPPGPGRGAAATVTQALTASALPQPARKPAEDAAALIRPAGQASPAPGQRRRASDTPRKACGKSAPKSRPARK